MSAISLLYFLIWIGSAISTISFNLYTKLFGYREIISIFLLLWGILMVITAYFPNIYNIAIMILMNGFFEGASTTGLGFMLIDMFAKNISLAIAISSLGTAFGIIVYAEFGMLMCNPHNAPASLSFKEGPVTYEYFDEDLATNLLNVFFVIGVIAIILAICLQLFTKNPEGIQNHILDYCPYFKNRQTQESDEDFDAKLENDSDERIALNGNVAHEHIAITLNETTCSLVPQKSLYNSSSQSSDKRRIIEGSIIIDYCGKSIVLDKSVVANISGNRKIWKTAQFWFLFLSLSFQISSAYFFVSSQKTYAIQNYTDKIINYTSYIACVGSILGRLGAGVIVDKFGHNIAIILASTVNILIIFSFYYFLNILWVYFIVIGMIFFVHGMITV